MDTVLIIFLSIISAVTIVSTFAVLREIVKERGQSKRARIDAEQKLRADMIAAIAEERERMESMQAEFRSTCASALAAPASPVTNECAKTAAESNTATQIAVTEERAASETVSEELPAAEAAVTLEGEVAKTQEKANGVAEGTVSFSATQRRTLEEQYAELNNEQKEFYDHISAYAAAKEGSKCVKNQRYKEYKLGSARIVRLRIKRGVLHCEFVMINRDFRNHISESKISVKEAATVIKVQNAAAVEVVLSSIDLAVQLIEEERTYKKQLARERRRQAILRAKQQSSST